MTKAILFAALLGLLLAGARSIETKDTQEVAIASEGRVVWSTDVERRIQTERSPNDQLPLDPFFNMIVQGDYVSASVGLRFGDGIIHLTGMPDCPKIEKAFLFWSLLSDLVVPPANINFNGFPIVGNLVDIGGNPCWGVDAAYVYVADVTPYVTLNGDYYVSGLPYNVPLPLTEGASLVVIFSHPSYSTRAVTIYAGANTINYALPLLRLDLPMNVQPVCAVDYSKTTFIVADSQLAGDRAYFNNVNLDGNDVFFEPYFQAVTFDVTSLVSSGDTVVTPSIEGLSDCLTWAAQVFSAPFCTQTSTCCSRIIELIDLLVFVAEERVTTGCIHINNIFESPPASCWENAISNVCGSCNVILQNYQNSVDNAQNALLNQCANLNLQIEAAAAAAKASLGSTCTEAEGIQVLLDLGVQINNIVNSMDLSGLAFGVLTQGSNSLTAACAVPTDFTWLCPAYFSQCNPANTQALFNAGVSIDDITTIINNQVAVSLGGLNDFC